MSETFKVTPRHSVTRLRRTRCVHQKTSGANDSQAVRWSKTRPPVSNCRREVPYCFICMTVLRSARVEHMGATEAPGLVTRTRKHHINPINHSTIAINLHVVQSATATLRTTHVTTCAELLPRRHPRASDGQDALTFCPTERAISDRRQMDATTFSRQTRSLRLLFGTAVGRSELLHQNFLETRKLEAPGRRTTDRAPSTCGWTSSQAAMTELHQTPPAASPLSPRELSTCHERTAWSNSPHASPKTDPSPGGSSHEGGSTSGG